MKFFGQIKRFTSLIFRDVEDAKDITLQFDPNTVYTANRVISLPSGDQNMVLMRYPLAGVTANTVPYFSDTTGNLSASETTATELGYVHNVTSAIQTQINGKEPTITTLAASKGGLATNASGFSGVVKAASGVFSAATVVNADISSSAAITGTKISPDFGSQVVITTSSISGKNLAITGTGTGGWIQLVQQSGDLVSHPSGSLMLFAKSDDKLYIMNSAGTANALLTTATTGTMPSYTTVQRDALTPAAGMVIYNTTTDRFQGYCAGAVAAWVNLHGWGA